MTHPARRPDSPRPWREAPIEEGRALRASLLRVRPTGEKHVFIVEGGEEAHWVNLRDDASDVPLCDCGDHAFTTREVLCKHAVAALLWRKDRRARRGLRRARVAETLAYSVKRAAAATVACHALAAAHGYTVLVGQWRVDASGHWWRAVRNATGGNEEVVVTFLPHGARVAAAYVVPF